MSEKVKREKDVEAANTGGDETVSAAQVTQARAKSVEAASAYTVDELAAYAEPLFHTSHDMVVAALEYNKIRTCTIREAEKIIKAFAERKVK